MAVTFDLKDFSILNLVFFLLSGFTSFWGNKRPHTNRLGWTLMNWYIYSSPFHVWWVCHTQHKVCCKFGLKLFKLVHLMKFSFISIYSGVRRVWTSLTTLISSHLVHVCDAFFLKPLVRTFVIMFILFSVPIQICPKLASNNSHIVIANRLYTGYFNPVLTQFCSCLFNFYSCFNSIAVPIKHFLLFKVFSQLHVAFKSKCAFRLLCISQICY